MDCDGVAPQRIPALLIASDTFTSRLVGVKGRRWRNTFPDAQHYSPSHEKGCLP